MITWRPIVKMFTRASKTLPNKLRFISVELKNNIKYKKVGL